MSDLYPLGEPIGRKVSTPKPGEPIDGRPNWYRTPSGEKYVEPPAKPKPVIPPVEKRPV